MPVMQTSDIQVALLLPESNRKMFDNNSVFSINLECAETASSLHTSKDLNHKITQSWHDSDFSGFVQPSEFRLSMLYNDSDCDEDYKCLDILPNEPAGSPTQGWLDYIDGVSPNIEHLLPLHPLNAQTVPYSPEITCVKCAAATDIHEVPCSPASPDNSKQLLIDKGHCTVPDVDNIATESETSDSEHPSHIVFSSNQRRTVCANDCEAEQSCFVTAGIVDFETSDSEELDYTVIGSSQESRVSTNEWEPTRSVNSCSLTSDHVVPNIEE